MSRDKQGKLGFVEDHCDGPVECLGEVFSSEAERREHFLALLAEKLKDPDFRATPGFPVGGDEAILELSDPPYYCACPNPFLGDLLSPVNKNEPYHCLPFAEDLTEKRTTTVYTAHPYHTKVPPRAVARLIMHYTDPGDTVLDAFAGTGMTGVAAGLCADQEVAREIGGEPGARRAVLCDLSPAATFIANGYLSPPVPARFKEAADQLLQELDDRLGSTWTIDLDGVSEEVEYVVWVECFLCPHCQAEILSERVLDATLSSGAANEFACSSCNGLVSKAPTRGSGASRLVRALRTSFDNDLGRPIKHVNRIPVAVSVIRGGSRQVVSLSNEQRERLLAGSPRPSNWYPTSPVVDGERFRIKDCLTAYGITHVHHFYLPRQLLTFSAMWDLARKMPDFPTRSALLFFSSSNAQGMTVLNRYAPAHHSQVNRYFSGTLYVPSTVSETSPRYTYRNKLKRLAKAFDELGSLPRHQHILTTQSATDLSAIPDDSVDYIFVDPPFGRNLQYSELNQIWEAWLQVHTDRSPEAVMDATRRREVHEYSELMRLSFCEMRRVLKPGRWMTVEFHNSANAVWKAIQEAVMAAGFVVADVRLLNKVSDTYKQSRQGLVKRDLIISAYKPTGRIEAAAEIPAGERSLVWEFVEMHLSRSPLFEEIDGRCQVISERQDYVLFDRMVGFHVQRGLAVPLSASDFRRGLEQRFPTRDGMYFLPDQVGEYDRKRGTVEELQQLELFVSDEVTAIQWLRQHLGKKPQSLQDLQPEFMQRTQSWASHEVPVELAEILELNFLCYGGDGLVPTQVHAYLSSNYKEFRNLDKNTSALREKAKDRWYVADLRKEGDLEQLRAPRLQREFERYVSDPSRKLNLFRSEAVRVGFKHC